MTEENKPFYHGAKWHVVETEDDDVFAIETEDGEAIVWTGYGVVGEDADDARRKAALIASSPETAQERDELRAALKELDRLSLVITSAVRYDQPSSAAEVSEAFRVARTLLAKTGASS